MNHAFEQLVSFCPIEQRYVASCYPLPDRPGFDACLNWRRTFSEYVRQNLESVTTSVGELAEPFPHLSRLALQGMFNSVSIQAYFEGLNFPEMANGVSYHNPNLYLFAAATVRHHAPPAILAPVLDHIAGCSVKPAILSSSRVIDYVGDQPQLINRDFLQHDTAVTDYVLVHGFATNGAHQAIRYLQPNEFDRFRHWFVARQQSKTNPFRRTDF